MKRLPALLLIIMPFAAGAEPSLSDCAGIESAEERLDCYDRVAGQSTRAKDEQVTEEKPAEPEPDEPVQSQQAVTPAPPQDERKSAFGKQAEDPAADLDHMDARIEHVRRTPRGNHIFTLSNGQVWMENEPNRRRIRGDQRVTIRKHRWHYEMEIEGIPDVPVHRVE